MAKVDTGRSLLIDNHEAAKLLGYSTKRLHQMRLAGLIPEQAIIRFGRSIRYKRPVLEAWASGGAMKIDSINDNPSLRYFNHNDRSHSVMSTSRWARRLPSAVALGDNLRPRFDIFRHQECSTSASMKLQILQRADTFLRWLQSGLKMIYIVTDRGCQEGLQGIPAHYQIEIRRDTNILVEGVGMKIYNLYGANPRVNIHSEDKSLNVTTVSPDSAFADLRRVLEGSIEEPDRKNDLLALTDEMEQSQGMPDFTTHYQNFIASTADLITILQPFIPALTQLLTGS